MGKIYWIPIIPRGHPPAKKHVWRFVDSQDPVTNIIIGFSDFGDKFRKSINPVYLRYRRQIADVQGPNATRSARGGTTYLIWCARAYTWAKKPANSVKKSTFLRIYMTLLSVFHPRPPGSMFSKSLLYKCH